MKSKYPITSRHRRALLSSTRQLSQFDHEDRYDVFDGTRPAYIAHTSGYDGVGQGRDVQPLSKSTRPAGLVCSFSETDHSPSRGLQVQRGTSSIQLLDDAFYESNLKLDIFFTIFSIIGYFFDLGSDIFVAVAYYHTRQMWWFGLTVSFIVLPSITLTAFSLAWYVMDEKNKKANNNTNNNENNEYSNESRQSKETSVQKVLHYVLFLIPLGPFVRYIDVLMLDVRRCRIDRTGDDRELKRLWIKKQHEATDLALLRLFKCFLESAPQLTLQLYIMSVEGIRGHIILVVGQAVSCFTSLCSLSWSLVAYQKMLRISDETKRTLSNGALPVMFVWRFFTIGARVIAFALFASSFSYWLFVLVGCHWSIMFFWILVQRTDFCVGDGVQEFFFNVVAAEVNIFCFFNVLGGHTRLRYVAFYALVYAENVSMVVVWYTANWTFRIWYMYPSLVAVFGLFFVGIFFQLVYYLLFHPTRGIRLYVPCSKLKEEAFDNA